MLKFFKWMIFFTSFSLLLISISSCQNTDDKDRIRTEKILEEAQKQVGMPDIKNYSEKTLLKILYEMRDQKDIKTFVYIVSENGKLVYLGQAIGYGIPSSAQYSNPSKPYNRQYSLPQAEPNGLFMPNTSQGNWLMMIDESTGSIKPVYIEPNVIISPFKLTPK